MVDSFSFGYFSVFPILFCTCSYNRDKLLIQIIEFYPISYELPSTNIPTNTDKNLIAEASFADLVQYILTKCWGQVGGTPALCLEIPRSKSQLKTHYPEVCLWFSSVPQPNSETIYQIRPWQLPSTSFALCYLIIIPL